MFSNAQQEKSPGKIEGISGAAGQGNAGAHAGTKTTGTGISLCRKVQTAAGRAQQMPMVDCLSLITPLLLCCLMEST